MIQQVERRRFVRADRQPSRRLVAQFGQRVFQVALQILEPAGIFEHDLAGIGQQHVLGRPVDQLLPQFRLKSLDRKGDSRLRAQQFFSRARKALLGRDRQKDAEWVHLHKIQL